MEMSFADTFVKVDMTKNLHGNVRTTYGKSVPLTANFFDPSGNAGNVMSAQANLAYQRNGQPVTELIPLVAPVPPDFQWRGTWLSSNADAVGQVISYSIIAKFADGTVSQELGQFQLVV